MKSARWLAPVLIGLAGCAGVPPKPPEMLDAAVVEAALPRASFAELGLDGTRWQQAVDQIERRALPIDQVALLVDGRLVAELHRFGHGPRSLHDLRSATKSITGLLAGAALARGDAAALERPIAPLFPEFADAPAARLSLRQLLSMRSGLDCDDWAPASRGHEERLYASADWLRFFFSLPQRGDAGAAFSYCTAGIVAAGEAVARLVRQPLPAFARQALFEPLGIAGESWQPAPRGIADAGGHLRLTLSAMLKIGELMRQRGVWQGRRVIDEAWIERSIEPAVRIDPGAIATQAWYGLGWWLEPVRDGRRAASFQARGNGGQFIIVLPELKAVVAFTGHAYNASLATQMAPFELVTEHLAPMLRARQ